MVSKGIQTADFDYDSRSSKNCQKCEVVATYCDFMTKKLSEVDESSRYLLTNCNNLKGQLDETKRVEENYIKACHDMESRFNELRKELSDKTQGWNECGAELAMLRTVLVNSTNVNGHASSSTMSNSQVSSSNVGNRSPLKNSNNNMKSRSAFDSSQNPIPSSLKAIIYAEICQMQPHQGS